MTQENKGRFGVEDANPFTVNGQQDNERQQEPIFISLVGWVFLVMLLALLSSQTFQLCKVMIFFFYQETLVEFSPTGVVCTLLLSAQSS